MQLFHEIFYLNFTCYTFGKLNNLTLHFLLVLDPPIYPTESHVTFLADHFDNGCIR